MDPNFTIRMGYTDEPVWEPLLARLAEYDIQDAIAEGCGISDAVSTLMTDRDAINVFRRGFW